MRFLFLFLILGSFTLFYASCDDEKSDESPTKKKDADSSLLLLEKYPDSVELINQTASNALQMGDTGRSIQLLSQSLGLKLDQPEVENQLGFLLAAIKSEQSLLIATRMTHSEKTSMQQKATTSRACFMPILEMTKRPSSHLTPLSSPTLPSLMPI